MPLPNVVGQAIEALPTHSSRSPFSFLFSGCKLNTDYYLSPNLPYVTVTCLYLTFFTNLRIHVEQRQEISLIFVFPLTPNSMPGL